MRKTSNKSQRLNMTSNMRNEKKNVITNRSPGSKSHIYNQI